MVGVHAMALDIAGMDIHVDMVYCIVLHDA